MLASKRLFFSHKKSICQFVCCVNFAVRQLEKAKVSIGQFGYKSMALNNSLINQVSPIDYGNNNNNNNSYLSANTNTVLNKCSSNALTVKNELLDLKLTHHHHHQHLQQQQQSAPMPHGIANSVFVLKKPPMSAMSPSHTSLNPAAAAHSSKKFKTIINISNNSNRNNTHLQHTTTSIASSSLTAANSIHNNINNNNNNSIANSIMNVIGAAHSSEQEYE